MKKLINLAQGVVRCEVNGASIEEFLNVLSGYSAPFWAIEKTDGCTLRVTLYGRDMEKASSAASRAGCDLKLLSAKGVPYAMKRLRKRNMLAMGLVLSMFLLAWSSLYVWDIEVIGNEKVPTSDILGAAADAGVREGAFWPSFSSDLIRSQMVMELSDIKWLTVNVKGSKAEIIVRERKAAPEIVDEKTPAHIVADKAGLITELSAYSGEAAAAVGKTVTDGEILISGTPKTRTGALRTVRSIGEVKARTWYEMKASAPLTQLSKEYTGDESACWALNIGAKRVNFYINSRICDGKCDKINSVYRFAVQGMFNLPVWLEKTTYREYELVEAAAARETVENQLKDALVSQLKDKLGDSGDMISADFEVIEENGTINVTMRAECSEQIGRLRELTEDEINAAKYAGKEDSLT